MKKLFSWSFVSQLFTAGLILVMSACADENVAPGKDASAALKPKPSIWTVVPGETSFSPNSNTVTFTIDGTGSKFAASHLLIQATNCAGAKIAPTGELLINNKPVTYTGTTGSGTECAVNSGSFAKVDSDELARVGIGKVFTVTASFAEPISSIEVLVKAGTTCNLVPVAASNCSTPPEVCYEPETSWAGPRSIKPKGASWYAFITLTNGATPVPATNFLWAGQHYNVGTVSVVKVNIDGVDKLQVTVTLTNGATLQEGKDNWYMESYATAPTARPISGQMAFKGEETSTSFTKTIDYVGEYVMVHVNVNRTMTCGSAID